METELIISIVFSFIIVFLGMYISYKEARKERFSIFRGELISSFLLSLIQLSALLSFGLIGYVISFSHRDKMGYLYPIVFMVFMFNFISAWIGYGKRKIV